jgi:hypothetical protein
MAESKKKSKVKKLTARMLKRLRGGTTPLSIKDALKGLDK